MLDNGVKLTATQIFNWKYCHSFINCIICESISMKQGLAELI